jgi:hypothetical protein
MHLSIHQAHTKSLHLISHLNNKISMGGQIWHPGPDEHADVDQSTRDA